MNYLRYLRGESYAVAHWGFKEIYVKETKLPVQG